ncbi:hypothetical protein Ga0466249_003889 [Sporomusaceae bacterium BoRhaA]|uniref:TIM barrel protein n=1 Tax=Pelorhabdus rhamnosifermentans TaxID=2772457 RepID=UPI001C05FDC6|nr:TIM barrel protein [Pelorhabdus rhamnosifermentans]MBU2702754.1 hypothetical protein [Pelorhabdus rhamnosifermentans]
MLQLTNLSNYYSDGEFVHHNAECLQAFLNHYHLDGLEMIFVEPWDEHIYKKQWIQGVHLRFWPCWLDFWRGNRPALLREFGSDDQIRVCFGGVTRDAWLDLYRRNIRLAVRAGAKYLVFHVSNARSPELFSWKFSASDGEVIEAAIEIINEIADVIPPETTLLFENLWWPGLTLRNPELTEKLLTGVKPRNVGIMLDTGHLMNTNLHLATETQGVDYILQTLRELEPYDRYVKGIHLHRSLSSVYVRKSRNFPLKDKYTPQDVMSHVLKIDEHLPFTTPEVRRIIEYVQPDYLVHEFVQASLNDWVQKIVCQQQALRMGTVYS